MLESTVAVVSVETPASDRATVAQAVVKLGSPDPGTPEAIARGNVEREPDSAQAWESLGSLLLKRGEFAEGSHCFEAALRIDPSLISALNKLAGAYLELGRLADIEPVYRAAIAAAPDNHLIQMNFASVLGQLGRPEEALEIVDGLSKRHPRLVRAHLLGAEMEIEAHRYEEALTWLEKAVSAAPQQLEIRTRRAELLWWLGRNEAALKECEFVLELSPSHARTLHTQALVLQALNRPAEALVSFRAAERSNPSIPAAVIADRAWLLAELGRKEEALAEFDRALKLQPDLAMARCRVAHLNRGDVDEQDLGYMERMADDADRPFQDRLNLQFAIGQAYLKRNEGDLAFARLEAGNAMMRSSLKFDLDAEERRFAEIATALSRAEIARLKGPVLPSSGPIFVFGMPRSGTSLVEQILDSHSKVDGAGEISLLGDLVESSGVLSGTSQLDVRALKELGRKYLVNLRSTEHGWNRVVDKMPGNYLYAGLVPLILPGARMIHCRRDPLDTCLSCYATLFGAGHEYAYDLAELGRFYRLYQRLMAHWRRVLPAASMLEVDYEILVADLEGQVRRMLDFCELPYEENCLRFHETENRVSTASLDQVRSPIYRTSVGRAQAFRPWLGPLEATLAGL